MITLNSITTNNLKSINVTFPYNKITAIVGGSGAGKSSLAFHTLYNLCKNELDILSGNPSLNNPMLEGYSNLLPAIALKQKNHHTNPRSSVFTFLNLDKMLLPLFLHQYPELKTNILSHNNPSNCCQRCEGLGGVFLPDENLIVDYTKPLTQKPFHTWNNFISSHYYPLLESFCIDSGIDMNKSLEDLTANEKKLILYSKSEKSYTIKFKQKSRYKQKNISYIGVLEEIEQACRDISVPGNRQKIQSYIKNELCPECMGARFSSNLLRYKLEGKNIHDIMLSSFETLVSYFESFMKNNILVKSLFNLCKIVCNNNLGYLTPARGIPTLSGGEFQRLLLSSVVRSEFSNLLYIIDEPSSSLHASEYQAIMTQILALKQKSSTIVIVDHQLDFIKKADKVIALEDGKIIHSSNWISEQESVNLVRNRKKAIDFRNVTIANYNNIKKIDVNIPLHCMIGCCGASGSGKSSFAEAFSKQKNVHYINQDSIKGSSSSIVATYLGLMQSIDKTISTKLNLPVKTFLFNNSASQCPFCEGKGHTKYEPAFASTIKIRCEVCEGKRYNNTVLGYKYSDLNIYEILSTPISKLVSDKIFGDNKVLHSKLNNLLKLGLGHLSLFMPTHELSGGEAQRIKLLANLKVHLKEVFLIVDEPTRGLDQENIKKLLNYFDELLPKTQGIMIIEHNTFLLSAMDYYIEFGPKGGDNGGQILYAGRPEDITDSNSIIKNYLSISNN